MAKQGPRKKLPKELAVINADNCTGCESCLEVCPVDCIELKTLPGTPGVKGCSTASVMKEIVEAYDPVHHGPGDPWLSSSNLS